MGEGVPTPEDTQDSPEYLDASAAMERVFGAMRKEMRPAGPLLQNSWRRPADRASIHATLLGRTGSLTMHEGHDPNNQRGSLGNSELTLEFALSDVGEIIDGQLTIQRGEQDNVPMRDISQSELTFIRDLERSYYDREDGAAAQE